MWTTDRHEVRFDLSAFGLTGVVEVVVVLPFGGDCRSTGASALASVAGFPASAPTLSGTDAASELTRPTGAMPASPKPARRRIRAQLATVAQASRGRRCGRHPARTRFD